MANTRYIQLTDYCLLEYDFYDLNPVTSNVIEDDIILTRNEDTNINQIYHPDSADPTIRNFQDVSTIFIGDNKFVYNDTEVVPNYSQYNSDISQDTLSSNDIPYDVVRFHFISGFNFDEFDALILSLAHLQNNNLENYFFQILVNPNTIESLIYLNSRPLFITDAIYDRYIQIKIPSIQALNEEYYSSSTPGNTLAGLLTPTDEGIHSGFIENAPIRVGIHECIDGNPITNEDDEDVIYEVYNSEKFSQASIPQISKFEKLGAVIQEASDGDYIQYYATDDGAFIEDFIGSLNESNPNDDWVVIHQLLIVEQVGSAFIQTSKIIDIQEDRFDEPREFRPILQNSDSAVSFSIDYLYRLLNRRDGDQVIRRGSFSSLDAKKYGKEIEPIALDGLPRSHKIYNRLMNPTNDVTKLFMEPTISSELSTSSESEVVERDVYIPVFFNVNRVGVTNRNTTVSNSNKEDDVIFKQGALRILLTPLDNTYKFKIYEILDNIPSPLNLDVNSSFYIVFTLNDNDTVRFSHMEDNRLENLSAGEIAFSIPKDNSVEILNNNNNNRIFYIISKGDDGTESIMYTGQWNKSSEQDQIDTAIDTAKSEAVNNTEDTTTESQPTTNPVENLDIPGVINEVPDEKDEKSSVLRKNPNTESGGVT